MNDIKIERIMFRGRPVVELEREELLACIKYLLRDQIRQQEMAKLDREMCQMFDEARSKF